MRTRINLLRTDMILLRHIVIQHKITIVSQTIYFSDKKHRSILGEDLFFLVFTLIWTQNHLILGEDLFFGLRIFGEEHTQKKGFHLKPKLFFQNFF